MLSTLPSRQFSLNWFRVTQIVSPLAVGVMLLTSGRRKAEAQPVLVQPQLPTTQIIGSPIPSPVPVMPGTNQPYSLSPNSYNPGNYSYSDYNYGNYGGYNYDGYNYGGYYNYGYSHYPQVITPGRAVIRNSTLINPTVINSRINDSVLVNPVIVNPSGYGRRLVAPSSSIYYSPRVYSPGIRVRIGY